MFTIILNKINSILIFISLILIYSIIMEYLITNGKISPLFTMLFTPLFIILALMISKLYLLYKNS